ncbi:MAG TPA: hypothetical protein V6D07_10350 [Trichocoleus sp.]
MRQNRTSTELPLGQLNAVLDLLLLLPRLWLGAAVLVILLSMVDITYSGQAGWTFSFSIKSITAVMFGLVWLPVLLRILAVAGGGIKTGAGEATTPGLVSLLPKLIATLDSVEPTLDGAEQAKVASVRQEAEQEWGALTVAGEADARQQLRALAKEYEEVRRVMPPGSQRTFRMREIAARVRALAGETHYGPNDMQAMFSQGSDGDRIVVLQMLLRYPHPDCINIMMDAIAHPHSAFEQYAALKAIEKVMPEMTPEQMKQLRQGIIDQQSGNGPDKILTATDPQRWALSERILKAIESRLPESAI